MASNMYCRGCLYDLRGQRTPRCPECGRAFDPGDPDSFFEHPGRWHRIRIEYKKYRIPCAVLLTTVWVIWMFFVSLQLGARDSHGWPRRAAQELKMITFQRMYWQRQDPPIRDFDRAAAVRDLPPLVSAYAERARIARRKRLNLVKYGVPWYAIPTAVYALLLILLVRGRQRRLALGVLVLCVALVPASQKVFEISDALLPEDPPLKPSHAYLDDYVHIDGIQFTSSDDDSNRTIAVYDIRSFEGDGLRLVGFANRHVMALRDDRARTLFEAQGLQYPVPTKPDADE